MMFDDSEPMPGSIDRATRDKAYQFLYKKHGEPIGEGKMRIVFSDGWHVHKYPIGNRGVRQNKEEFEAYQENSDIHELLAKTQIYYIDTVPIIEQEVVRILSFSEIYALSDKINIEWLKEIDTEQVGVNKDGNLVLYDFSRPEIRRMRDSLKYIYGYVPGKIVKPNPLAKFDTVKNPLVANPPFRAFTFVASATVSGIVKNRIEAFTQSRLWSYGTTILGTVVASQVFKPQQREILAGGVVGIIGEEIVKRYRKKK
jgi:hypothetical protein